MVKRGDAAVLRYLVNFLRFHTGMTQKDFGRECRIDQAEISRFELGKLAPSEEQLRRMAEVAGIDWSLVIHGQQFYASLLSAIGRDAVAPGTFDLKSLEPVLLAVSPYLLETCSPEPARPTSEEEKREAERIWEELERHPIRFRRRLIEVSPDSGNWALAMRVCEASVKSAAHDAKAALELAELAVSIAERVSGEVSWRSRFLGYCWAHVANARRVSNDLVGADAAFSRTWELWKEGVDSGPALLGEWVLPSLEASLRRDQCRFSEALKLLDLARGCQGGSSPTAQLILFFQKERLFERMGDPRNALGALMEAAPLVEAAGDARLLFALRFNMADDLCQLERYEEAAHLLPQVREMAGQQANDLDLLRVNWLSARVAAGEGRTAEAMAGLEQVSRDFTVREQPYNAALSSLDLAVLLLKAGRTAEVKGLAVAMGRIFKAKGISREALASLKVFCDAAQLETATVELARKAMAEIELLVGRSVPSASHAG